LQEAGFLQANTHTFRSGSNRTADCVTEFAIVKPFQSGNYFQVIDTTQSYGTRSLLPQMTKRS
jgi:hypothetical protein